MNYTKLNTILKYTIVLLLVLFAGELVAQCPMCKMAASSNLKNGGTAGKGLNLGILYILALPYMMVMFLGYVWWKNRKKGVDEEGENDGKIQDYKFSNN